MGSEDRAQKKADFYQKKLKNGDLENKLTLKIRSMSPKSYQLFILSQ